MPNADQESPLFLREHLTRHPRQWDVRRADGLDDHEEEMNARCLEQKLDTTQLAIRMASLLYRHRC